MQSNLLKKSRTISALVLGVVLVLTLCFVNLYAAPVTVGNFTVDYVIQSDWGAGATINITLKNNGPAIQGWSVGWTFPGNQIITNMWGASYTQSGASVTAKNVYYNASLPTGGSQSFGFNVNYSGTNAAPSNFTVNSSSTTTPTPSAATTPTLGGTPTRGATPSATPLPTSRQNTPTPTRINVTATPTRRTVTSTPTPTPTRRATPTATVTPTPTQNIGKTFYTTSVQDDLDAQDRVMFENQFRSLGYSFLGNNTNVSASQLNSLMGRSDITTLYHTGHGYDSGIATAGGDLSVSQVTGVNNQNFIAATCLTLTSTSWKTKMSSSCHSVLGYTKVSYDITDNEVVTRMASELKAGRSYIQAWYTANIVQSLLSDRWCGYIREGSSIVEYSARTNIAPKAAVSMQPMNSAGTLKVANQLLSDTNTYDNAFSKICNYEIKIKGSREHFSQFYQKGTEFLNKVAMSQTQGVIIADKWISAALPVDAKQEATIQIEATDDSGVPQVIGHVVRYTRYLDGLPIRTNGAEDHIALLVNNNTVISMSKIWPVLEVKATPGAIAKGKILSVNQAIRIASAQIARMIKKDQVVEIIDAKPCYGMTSAGLAPAYELTDSQGSRIIINAMTGELIF